MRTPVAVPTMEWARGMRDKILATGWCPIYYPHENLIRFRCWRAAPLTIPPALVALHDELDHPQCAAAFIRFLQREYLADKLADK